MAIDILIKYNNYKLFLKRIQHFRSKDNICENIYSSINFFSDI